MSKTSIKERNKAIRLAWEREQELVSEGKGTRDWSQDQQKDILDPDKGKAYDENGRAFEGQHMKSAVEYPEYQGDPDNIQFLTREEHLEAHNGNWKNPTNWYFNPITKEKVDFGDGSFIPCEIIQLSEPIAKLSLTVETRNEKISEFVKEVDVKEEPQCSRKRDIKKIEHINTVKSDVKQTKGFRNKVRKVFTEVINFSNRHPVISKVAKCGFGVIGLAIADAIINGSRSGSDSDSSDCDYTYPQNGSIPFSSMYDEIADETVNVDSSTERSSPEEHTVKRHSQRYHYNDGSVKWKEKDPYSRGGNKD